MNAPLNKALLDAPPATVKPHSSILPSDDVPHAPSMTTTTTNVHIPLSFQLDTQTGNSLSQCCEEMMGNHQLSSATGSRHFANPSSLIQTTAVLIERPADQQPVLMERPADQDPDSSTIMARRELTDTPSKEYANHINLRTPECITGSSELLMDHNLFGTARYSVLLTLCTLNTLYVRY